MIEISLFGGEVRGAFYGRGYGTCHTNPIDSGAIGRIDQVSEQFGAKGVILPNISHGTNIVQIDRFKNGGQVQLLDCRVTKTIEPADGLVTTNPDLVLGVANADCPVGVIYHRESRWLCLLHLGLKCLLARPSIIDEALKLAPVPAVRLSFEFGFGIRGCCFGYTEGHEHVLAVRQLACCALNGLVRKGPRQGQMSIHLPSIIWALASRRFGSTLAISGGSACTACREDVPGYSHVWSECRPHERGQRNLFVVKLAP